MDNESQYVLISNNCDQCKYIVNAFTLLRLPLRVYTLNESPKHIHHGCLVIACQELEKQQGRNIYEAVNNADAHLISFLETNAAHHSLLNKPRYLTSGFSKTELVAALAQAAIKEVDLGDESSSHPAIQALIGNSKQIRIIRSLIRQVANTDSTVLILGQSGTGKDLVASCIHHFSKRKNNSFVPINCGAIPGELMESELFGHEKGSFTGASMRRLGRFEIANKGTLFLDEIGDMPLPMQVKLLRVLQERKIDRVGGNESIKVDVRIIAATNKNIEKQIAENRFREDLFYRLNVFPIQMPTLQERAEDIPALIDFHLEKIALRLQHKVHFTDKAIAALCRYSWPGNIRELENFLERMAVIHRDSVLDENDLDPTYKQGKKPSSTRDITEHKEDAFNFKEYIANLERQAIELALQHSNGLVDAAAKYLSLAPKTLLEKMKKYGLTSA